MHQQPRQQLHPRRRSRPLAAMLTLAVLGAGLSILAAHPAHADRSALTFRKVAVDGRKVTITYTINRRPSHITGRTCTLSNGIGKVAAKCGLLPRKDTRPSRVTVVLRNVPLGEYTFTVRASHKRSLIARNTTKPFTVGNGLTLDQSSLSHSPTAGSRAPIAPSCPDAALGADQAQTFTAGSTGELRAVSVVVFPEGPTPDLVVDITTLSGGVPDSVIGTGTYGGSGSADLGTFTTIRLSSPATLTEGQQYAIVLSSPDPTNTCAPGVLWSVAGDIGATYADGTWQFMFHGDPWQFASGDLSFMTWMVP